MNVIGREYKVGGTKKAAFTLKIKRNFFEKADSCRGAAFWCRWVRRGGLPDKNNLHNPIYSHLPRSIGSYY